MKRSRQYGNSAYRSVQSRRRTGRGRSSITMEMLEPRLMLSTTPNDPMFSQQWHLNNTGQYAEDPGISAQAGFAGDDISAEKAWDITTGSDDVVIGILDSGMDITHPDLVDNVFTNTKEIPNNGIDDDGNGYVDDVHGWDFTDNIADVTDYVGHGTHVAGIVGARGNNGVGVTGVNWNVKLLPLKVGIADTDYISLQAAIAGIEYAVTMKHSGVNIVAINASFGGYATSYDPYLDQALHDAANAGILIVVSAGNESANGDTGGYFNNLGQPFPAKYSQNNPNVITVAATDNQDNLAWFSNFGPASVNVAAPGVAVTSTWSRMVDGNNDQNPDQVAYKTISGTSMAAPVVTGILGLEAAANPNASMLQLKDALLNSVKPLPSLQDMFYNSPNLVTTGGRVDAYNAVLNVRNLLVSNDSSSSGNWIGSYGSQGQYVIGLDNQSPSYVEMLLRGDDLSIIPPGGNSMVQGEVVDALANKPSALQIPGSSGQRIVGRLTTDTRMLLDLNFTDGQTHRVTFYVADTENLGRTEEIIVHNASDGRMLDYQGVWDFQNGRYVTFDLTGHVLVAIHNTSPRANAVLNGVFFDAAPQSPTPFVKEDDTTGGAWQNHYGSQGAFVVGQSTEFPPFLGVLLEGDATGRVLPKARDVRAMDNPDITNSHRSLAYYATSSSMTFDMHFTDNQVHQVGVYFVDHERAGRVERVDILDDGGNLLDSRIISDFGDGKYLFWNLQGNQKIRISRIAGPDAVMSGFVFDAPPGGLAQFVGSDRTTQGNWHGIYGYNSAVVLGDDASYLPSFATVQIEDGNRSEQVVKASADSQRAPLLVDSLTERMVTYLHTTTQMSLDIKITDNQIHRFSIYALDWDRQGRAERIELIDPDTNQVLSRQDIANFEDGIYLSWNIRGHVELKITRLAGPTAPISAFYFD